MCCVCHMHINDRANEVYDDEWSMSIQREIKHFSSIDLSLNHRLVSYSYIFFSLFQLRLDILLKGIVDRHINSLAKATDQWLFKSSMILQAYKYILNYTNFLSFTERNSLY
jgi:hypothetical protein